MAVLPPRVKAISLVLRYKLAVPAMEDLAPVTGRILPELVLEFTLTTVVLATLMLLLAPQNDLVVVSGNTTDPEFTALLDNT